MNASAAKISPQDRITKILIATLLVTIVVCWSLMIWATVQTYRQVAPIPQQFVNQNHQVVMSQSDIIAGKAAFQQADLMDYGSLYGMGSYFGEDYTAEYLVQLGKLTENNLAKQQFHLSFSQLSEGNRFVVRKKMQEILQHIPLTDKNVILP